jgi:hypothetical protein
LQEAQSAGHCCPQPVDHLRVRATLVQLGMLRSDVEWIVGAPAQADSFVREDDDLRVLKYPAEPIATAVTITDDRLSGVALDIAGVDDPALLDFSPAAWLGTSRSVVL